MLERAGLGENLRFLILEVKQQLERTERFLARPYEAPTGRLATRDDYIDNLKRVIQGKCFSLASEEDEPATIQVLQAVDVVAGNLERIADFCENISQQGDHLESTQILQSHDFSPHFELLGKAVVSIERALFEKDVRTALEICRAESRLDELYAEEFAQVMAALEAGQPPHPLVTLLFICRYLERAGDAMLNIGEAIISACLGERIKIDQFRALEDSLDDLLEQPLDEQVNVEAMGETRSGCRIDLVRTASSGGGERAVIFKEGARKKILAEAEGIERWREVDPELPPRVLSFHEEGSHASILLEFLGGSTLEHILLGSTLEHHEEALDAIWETLSKSWDKTLTREATGADYMGQLRARLEDVYAVHPGFRTQDQGLGALRLPGLESLVERAAEVEAHCQPPFSVLIHGDLNLDNVLYDRERRRVHFIDLHRSRPFDYVQDVTVFLLSGLRLQGVDAAARGRIQRSSRSFLDRARGFAARHGDHDFEVRAALGIARSYLSSTRFILDEEMALPMNLKARYLLERLVSWPKDRLRDFRISEEIFGE